MSRYVFDSYALLAHFKGQLGDAQVGALLQAPAHERWITEINAGEVYYIAAKEAGQRYGEEVLNELLAFPLDIAKTDWGLVLDAAKLKASHPISYADCFAVALARRLKAAVVTGDPEFQAVEHLVDIEWLPPMAKHRRRR